MPGLRAAPPPSRDVYRIVEQRPRGGCGRTGKSMGSCIDQLLITLQRLKGRYRSLSRFALNTSVDDPGAGSDGLEQSVAVGESGVVATSREFPFDQLAEVRTVDCKRDWVAHSHV
jgi:hypothetical protein